MFFHIPTCQSKHASQQKQPHPFMRVNKNTVIPLEMGGFCHQIPSLKLIPNHGWLEDGRLVSFWILLGWLPGRCYISFRESISSTGIDWRLIDQMPFQSYWVPSHKYLQQLQADVVYTSRWEFLEFPTTQWRVGDEIDPWKQQFLMHSKWFFNQINAPKKDIFQQPDVSMIITY